MPTEATEAYPAPRGERNPPSGLTAALVAPRIATPPRMRVFTFDMSALATSRSTSSTPRLNGLCMLRSIAVVPRAVADPPTNNVELGYSQVPVTENHVAITAAKPFASFHERVVSSTSGQSALQHGPALGTINNPLVGPTRGLDVIVPIPDPIITCSIVNVGAVAGPSIQVTLTVLENIAPESLLAFL